MVVGGRFNTPPPSVVDLAVPTCHFGSSCQCAAWTSGVGELLGCLVIFDGHRADSLDTRDFVLRRL
jgi:hypothetical protein